MTAKKHPIIVLTCDGCGARLEYSAKTEHIRPVRRRAHLDHGWTWGPMRVGIDKLGYPIVKGLDLCPKCLPLFGSGRTKGFAARF